MESNIDWGQKTHGIWGSGANAEQFQIGLLTIGASSNHYIEEDWSHPIQHGACCLYFEDD